MITDLNKWLDKHSWTISEDRATSETDIYDDEEREEGYKGYLSRDDVLIASDEATAEHDKEEYIKDNQDELLNEYWEKEQDSIIEEYKEIELEVEGTDSKTIKQFILESEEFKEFTEQQFQENRTPDDYYPIWLTAWEFPSGYRAETLNSFGVSGIVFFEVKGTTFVSLTACGMDMTPSLEYAYFMYSDVGISKSYIKRCILKQPSYFSYVVGQDDFIKLCEKLGITKRKIELAEKRVRERLKEFDKSLDNLSKLRDEGKMTQNEVGLLGLMTYFKHQEKEKQEVKQMA